MQSFLSNFIKKEIKNDTHTQLTILRIFKFSYLNKNAKSIKENLDFYTYKKQKMEITKISPATGVLRDLQLAHVKLLTEFDRICKENGLKYWLDFGTLLGAIRHKGFIPWDDDIDLGMLYDDYLKLEKIFNSSVKLEGFYLVKELKPHYNNYWLTIRHNECGLFRLDIFPYFRLDANYNKKERLKKTRELKKIRNSIPIDTSGSEQKFADIQKQLLLKSNADGDFACGIEFNHRHKYTVFAAEDMFPLKEIEFENNYFPTVSNVATHMEEIYGNYMDYPSNITSGHSLCKKMSEKDINIIKNFVS